MGCDNHADGVRVRHEFQSTHPCGVRRGTFDNTDVTCEVSIHAPVWGATRHFRRLLPRGRFNPRTRVGCDLDNKLSLVKIKAVSIHAPVWGATQSGRQLVLSLKLFQSTHPCGVRLSMTLKHSKALLFQSTHPCGVRPSI